METLDVSVEVELLAMENARLNSEIAYLHRLIEKNQNLKALLPQIAQAKELLSHIETLTDKLG